MYIYNSAKSRRPTAQRNKQHDEQFSRRRRKVLKQRNKIDGDRVPFSLHDRVYKLHHKQHSTMYTVAQK